MSFRTVVLTHRAKLNLHMGYIEIRDDDTKKIFLDDIDILVIESMAVSMTSSLISELMKKKIKVIFCDSHHNPQGELVPYYGSGDTARKVKKQSSWREDTKGLVWTEIVTEKIRNQSLFLKELGREREYRLLQSYISNMQYRDSTNREGLAAKVYFDALFGMDFVRNSESAINSALDYGYSLILSLVNREIAYNGYITQLGLFHDNIYNSYNLSSDLMEPFRILVDRLVLQSGFTKFESEEKHVMVHLFETEVKIGRSSQVLTNAVRIYIRSVFDALNDDNVNEILWCSI